MYYVKVVAHGSEYGWRYLLLKRIADKNLNSLKKSYSKVTFPSTSHTWPLNQKLIQNIGCLMPGKDNILPNTQQFLDLKSYESNQMQFSSKLNPKLDQQNNSEIEKHSHRDHVDHPTNNSESIPEGNKPFTKVPSEEMMHEVARKLCKHISTIFISNYQDYNLYRHDILFENKIHDQVVSGWTNYVQKVGLLRIYAHLRFVFVQLQVKSVAIEKEEGVIIVKFCCKGYGMLKLAIDYIPKKLYKRENMSREAKVWFEAISYYHVDEEGKIFRHVLDNKEQDKEKPIQSTVESKKDKVLKLREKGIAPSPAL